MCCHVGARYRRTPSRALDIKALMRSMEEAPIAANQTLAATSAIYTWAVKEEILSVNPCRRVERNPTTSRERVLSASEIPLVWSALTDAGVMAGTALKLILLLGQRPGEVAHMRFEHIKDGWWEMPGEPIPDVWPGTKNGSGHRVPLSKPAKELLASLEGEAVGYVFANVSGGALDGLDSAMRNVCRKLGIDRATPPRSAAHVRLNCDGAWVWQGCNGQNSKSQVEKRHDCL